MLADDVHVGNFVEVKASTIGARLQGQSPRLHRRHDDRRATSTSAPASITCNYDGANKHPHRHRGRRASSAPNCVLVAPVTIGARRDDRRAAARSREDAPAGTLTVARARQVSVPGWKRPVKKPKVRKADAMCGIVGAVVRAQRRSRPDRGPAPARVPRLRLDRPRGPRRRGRPRSSGCVSTARVADLAAQAEAAQLAGSTGISHTRWATHGAPSPRERASARVAAARSRSCTTASSRTTRSCATRLQEAGLRLRHADRHRGDRAPGPRALARRGGRTCCARCSSRVARVRRRVRDRGDVDARAGPRRRRARRAARWSSAWATASTSSPPTRRRCCRSTRRVIYLEEGDVADVRRESATRSSTRDGSAGRARGVTCRDVAAPRSSSAPTATSCRRRSSSSRARSPTRSKASTRDRRRRSSGRRASASLRDVDSVLILACGTSYYSGLVAQATGSSRSPACRARSRSRANTAIATACPTRSAGRRRLAVGRDRRHARGAEARARRSGHAHTLAICNVATSAMVRQTALTFLTRAGAEIGVASTKAFTTQLVALFLLDADAREAARPARRRGARRSWLRGAAPPAGGAAGARSRSSRRSIAWAGALREEAARAVPRPRPALPDRARRRAQAQGDLVHPRRGLSGRRAEARPARAGRRGHAGGRDRAERRAAREAQVQHAGSARARRRALRLRRPRQPSRVERGRARDPPAASTRGCCRRSCTRFRCSCSPITRR